MTPSPIPSLVAGIKDVLARTTDPDEITRSVEALAKPLAVDRGWLEARCYETEDDQGIGIAVFHEEPNNSILVEETVCWLPGRGVALEGEECNVTCAREDGVAAHLRAQSCAREAFRV